MKSFLFLALLLFLLPSCGLHQKVNCDCSCRCLNRGGNESLGSLSVKFGREIKNNQDSSFFYSKYQMIRFSQNGIYDGISTYKLSQDEIIDKNNLTYWAFRSNSCYRVNDSLIITESHAPLNWNLSYYLYKNDKLIYLYSGRRFFNRCKLYNYEEVMNRAKKNGWNINKAQTYHKVDSSNLVQINELLNYSYAFVFDLKHTITYEEFKEKLITDFSPTSEKIGAIAFFDNNNDKSFAFKITDKNNKGEFLYRSNYKDYLVEGTFEEIVEFVYTLSKNVFKKSDVKYYEVIQ